MDDDPPSIAPGTDQQAAAARMIRHRESSLAVVDQAGSFIGVIPPYRLLGALLADHDAVGTQTETLMVRGMSVGIAVREVVRLEVVTGALVGLVVSTAFLPFAVLVWHELDVAFTVALALFTACSTATLVALALPWLFQRLDIDPAFGSGPLATVVQDLLSILIYFGFVQLLL
jgi:Mg/Co/Ni transporter MgtE